jgi:hypothetical protein
VLATIHILCDADPSPGTAIVKGLLAWATALGGFTALGSGLPAAALAFNRATPPQARADQINRGVGVGFLFGMAVGALMFIVFSARLVS